MPLYYCFKDSKGEKVSLNKIDRLVCEEFGIDVDENVYSIEFQTICLIGETVYAKGEWNEERFLEIVKNDYRLERIARRFLKDEYTYDCWFRRC